MAFPQHIYIAVGTGIVLIILLLLIILGLVSFHVYAFVNTKNGISMGAGSGMTLFAKQNAENAQRYQQ